jgi:hypothetical protein
VDLKSAPDASFAWTVTRLLPAAITTAVSTLPEFTSKTLTPSSQIDEYLIELLEVATAVTFTGEPLVEPCFGLQIVTEGIVVLAAVHVLGGVVVLPKKSLISDALAAAPGIFVVTPKAASIVLNKFWC